MTNKMNIMVEGGHEHPFLYAAFDGERTGMAKGHLALGVLSVSQYLEKVKEGYKTATDPSFHSTWVKEEYAINNIEELKKRYPNNVEEYVTQEGKVYKLTEIPAFIEGRSQMIENIKGREKEFMKDLSDWMEYAKACGFSSFNDQYIQPTLLSHILNTTGKENDVYSKLTAINLPWWDLKYVSDEEINNIIEWSNKHNIDLGVKILLDGSFGAGTVGLSSDYERVFKEKNIGIVVEFLKKYKDNVRCLAFHAIGNQAVVDAAEVYKHIKEESDLDIIPYISHIEVVDNKVLEALDEVVLKNGGYISPQVNFIPFDSTTYSSEYDVFKEKDKLCPLRTLIRKYGYEKVKIGTDGMPLSIPYYLVSAYDHPSDNERLKPDELYKLLESNERKDRGEAVVFNIDKFEELLKEEKTRKQYLQNPYNKVREEMDREIIG